LGEPLILLKSGVCDFLTDRMQLGSPWPHNPSAGFAAAPYQNTSFYNHEQVYALVKRLTSSPIERSDALHTLSVHREQIPDLAVLLWESPATITALLAEILSIYPHLVSASTSSTAPTSLNSKLAARVCNVLALFQ
jgi:hypothetical protein